MTFSSFYLDFLTKLKISPKSISSGAIDVNKYVEKRGDARFCRNLIFKDLLKKYMFRVGGWADSHPETGRRRTMCVASIALATERSSYAER